MNAGAASFRFAAEPLRQTSSVLCNQDVALSPFDIDRVAAARFAASAHSVSGIRDRCACVFRQFSNCWRSSSISVGIAAACLVSINLSSLAFVEGRLTLPARIRSFHAPSPEVHVHFTQAHRTYTFEPPTSENLT